MALGRAVNGVFIVGAKRTAFGTFGGKLKDKTVTQLQEIAARAALASSNVAPDLVGSLVLGNVVQSSKDAIYMARHVGLLCRVPVSVPSLVVNRLNGSGFQAVINGAQEINLGESEIALVGGTDSMSQIPYVVRDVRFGTRFGKPIQFEDHLWENLTNSHTQLAMGMTAEKLARQYGVNREDCDRYALQSQQRWAKSQKAGVFQTETTPMELEGRRDVELFEVDEHPRPGTSLESLAKLPPVFKEGGTVTVRNASGMADGAAALVLASEAALTKYGLTPLARLVSYGIAGTALSVNEAFAGQYLAVEKELGLDPEITNINGGAIALGHPLAASGARITGHLAHELRRQNKKFGLGSACIGGGQGITVILERC